MLSLSLIITILLFIALSTGTLAEVDQDSIYYPSSTVRQHQDGLNILHSYINRDPIEIDEDLQKYDVCCSLRNINNGEAHWNEYILLDQGNHHSIQRVQY
jgi:hypothetical protein